MNPPIKRATVLAKITLLLSVVSLVSIFLMNGTVATSVAQSDERELDDQLPKHLPIKIKIKKEKEKAFKDIKNEDWMRDFELEVTNIGDKPIYFMSLVFTMPEITAPDGNIMGFSLNYGRSDLVSFLAPVKPEDVPLNPGDTYVFKIRENLIKGWQKFRNYEKKPQPKRIRIELNLLNFGDGTGFESAVGTPVLHPLDTKSSLGNSAFNHLS